MMDGFQTTSPRCTVLARVFYPNREVTGADDCESTRFRGECNKDVTQTE